VRLKIGSFLRPNNEATANISYRPLYDAKQRMYGVMETWQISGRLTINPGGQTEMDAALRILRRDFSQQEPDLVFMHDDGFTESEQQLKRQNCVSGPTVTALGLPRDAEDVYATGMTYTATFEAETRLSGATGNPIIEFNETLSNPEGGTKLGFVGGSIGLAERQVFQQNAPYIYIQAGFAVGKYGYVAPPLPLWPNLQLERNKPVLVGPRKLGRINTEYVTQWSYRMGNEFPLSGVPHEL